MMRRKGEVPDRLQASPHVPRSSRYVGAVERVFSSAGLAVGGRKSRNKDDLLNEKLIVYLNRHITTILGGRT